MRILVLSSKLPYPPKDGGAIATLSLLKGLAALGFDVTLLSFNTRKHYYPEELLPGDLTDSMKIYTVNADTTISLFGAMTNLLFSRKPYIARRFENAAFHQKLSEILKEQSYDIIQMEGPYMASYLPLIRKFSRAKVVLRAHNIEHEIWNGRWQKETNPLQKVYLRNLTKRIKKLETDLLQKVDAVLPISGRDEAVLQRLNSGIKTCVVPTGIDSTSYPADGNQHTKDLFFLGALDWVPNQEGLKWFIDKVLPLIDQTKPGISIHVAGRNAPASFVKLLNHRMIQYHGEIEDARTFMLDHGIMIVPLLTGSGIRIKILEGMAMGKCIITTTTGAEGIPAIDGKHLFIADDPETFKNTLFRVMKNDALAGEVSASAKKLVQEKFDTFAISSRLGEFYNKLA